MSLPKLYQKMMVYLEAMIASGAYAPGDKLPAQRDLCNQFSLTKGTVARGLEQLEKRGLIELRRGAGAFVRRRCSDTCRHPREIGVLIEYHNPAYSYCGQILTGVQARAAECGCGLHLNFTRYEDYTPESLARYAEKFDAVMLIGLYDTVARELPRNRPCVGINMYHDYGFASTVDLDPVAAAELATAYFQKRRCRKIVCCAAPKQPGILRDIGDFRARIFETHWPGEFQIADLDAADTATLIRLNAEPETGLLFVSGSRFEHCAVAYRKHTGRKLADDGRILSIDGKSLLIPEFQKVDTIGTDYPAMGVLAFEECLRRIENPGSGPRRIYQHVQLHLRPGGKA